MKNPGRSIAVETSLQAAQSSTQQHLAKQQRLLQRLARVPLSLLPAAHLHHIYCLSGGRLCVKN